MNKDAIIGDLIIIFGLFPVVFIYSVLVEILGINMLSFLIFILISLVLILIHGKITDDDSNE